MGIIKNLRDSINFYIGRYWFYCSVGSHWFRPWKDENGVWMCSIGYLKILRYPSKEFNPGKLFKKLKLREKENKNVKGKIGSI